MTYVEAKFGLRIRDSKPRDTGSRVHSDPMDVMRSTLSSGTGKGSSSPRDGCFKCGGAHVQRYCNARRSTGKQNRLAKAKTEQVKENKGKSKGKSKGTKGAKGSHKVKHRKLVSQVLKTRNHRQARKLRNLHEHVPLYNSWIHDGWSLDERNDGWSFDECNDDWSSVG